MVDTDKEEIVFLYYNGTELTNLGLFDEYVYKPFIRLVSLLFPTIGGQLERIRVQNRLVNIKAYYNFKSAVHDCPDELKIIGVNITDYYNDIYKNISR